MRGNHVKRLRSQLSRGQHPCEILGRVNDNPPRLSPAVHKILVLRADW
jgi:hypothetical protein